MRVFLRALEPDDYLNINRWRKNEEHFALTMANKYFISSERDNKWVEDRIHNDKEQIVLVICKKEEETMIGYLSIVNIDWRNRKAQWGGITIGEDENKKKGYASEATQLLLDFVFNELGLNKFFGYWLEGHEPSLKLAKKLGFKQDGILREEVYKTGTFHNAIVLSILQREYKKQK